MSFIDFIKICSYWRTIFGLSLIEIEKNGG
jgi:hypothetical protein